MGAPRLWPALAAIVLLAQPAWGQGRLNPETFQRDMAAGNVLVEQWIGCAQKAATILAGASQEGAEVVAIAVFGTCSRFQEKFYQHLLQINMNVGSANDLIRQVRGKMRERIIAQVLTVRAK